jgi:hypothetical protein
MTSAILIPLVSIIVVGFVALRSGGDARLKGLRWVRGAMIAALIPLGLQVLVLAMFGFGEMASGDLSGAGHLLPLAATLLLAFLAWKRPIEGGVALVLVGLATVAQFHDATARMIMAIPQLLGGGLFLVAGLGAWVASRHKGDQGA